MKPHGEIIRKTIRKYNVAPKSNPILLLKRRIAIQYKSINRLFNVRLQQQEDGVLEKGFVYNLGMPSIILTESGISYLPIELAARRLTDKAMQMEHPFGLSEIMDLPLKIQNPLAVFRSATVVGSFVILTELKHGKQSFVVALQKKGNKQSIIVNSIRSVHYRRALNIIGWINDDLAEYFCSDFIEKWLSPIEKELLSKPQYNSVDVRKQFKSAAKIIQNL